MVGHFHVNIGVDSRNKNVSCRKRVTSRNFGMSMSIRSRKPLLATIWKVDAGRSGKSESGMGIQLLFKFFYVGIFFLFVLCAYTKILSLETKIKFNRIFVNVLYFKALNEQTISH
jgi:hypothetical protein